jgi:FkbM family methyltransferase
MVGEIRVTGLQLMPVDALACLGKCLSLDESTFHRVVLNDNAYEYVEIRFSGGPLRYATPSALVRARVETLFSREPTTAAWIASFACDDIFVDVGANFGLYSMYAASVAGARVYAFEPESQNYAELNKNIFLNSLHERVTGYCLALTDRAEISHLLLCSFSVGFGHHDFGASSWAADLHRGSVTFRNDARLRQGSVGLTLDALVDGAVIPVPNHIKLDVDGFEWKVIKGAERTLGRPEVQSVLIETDFTIKENVQLIELMRSRGWQYSDDQIRIFEEGVLSVEEARKVLSGRLGQQNIIFFRGGEQGDKYARLFAECATRL